MELMTEEKKRFKRTDIGLIPEDWELIQLSNYTSKIGSGITPRGGKKVYQNYGRPFVRSQNIGWGFLRLEDLAFIDDETHATFNSSEIEDNDVLLNITGASIGRCSLANNEIVEGNVNQHVCIIRTVKDLIEPKFLNLILLSEIGQKQIDSYQAGGNREGLNFGQIGSFLIPLPPTLAEQQAIASALSDVDELIRSLDGLIQKKQAIKKGTMQQLLTGKKRLPGFDGEWEVKKLGDLAENITTGRLDANAMKENGAYPFFTCAKKVYKIDDYAFDAEALLVSGNGANVGYVHHYKGKFNAYQRTYVVTDFDADVKFIKSYLDYYLHERIQKEVNAGNTPYIKMDTLTEMDIRIPSTLEEQQAIAQILSDMDWELQTLRQKRKKYVQIKQGMMQELLTGKTRLV